MDETEVELNEFVNLEFDNTGIYMIVVAQKDVTVNDTVNAILALIKQNPSITYEDLTEKTGKSRRTISRIITELKTTGTLVRVGSDKSGHWEIN